MCIQYTQMAVYSGQQSLTQGCKADLASEDQPVQTTVSPKNNHRVPSTDAENRLTKCSTDLMPTLSRKRNRGEVPQLDKEHLPTPHTPKNPRLKTRANIILHTSKDCLFPPPTRGD